MNRSEWDAYADMFELAVENNSYYETIREYAATHGGTKQVAFDIYDYYTDNIDFCSPHKFMDGIEKFLGDLRDDGQEIPDNITQVMEKMDFSII